MVATVYYRMVLRLHTPPPLAEAMVEAGLQEVDTYVSCCQNTVAKYIVTMLIMDLCLAAERRPGTRVYNQWWEQYEFDLEGMRTADQEANGNKERGGGGGVKPCPIQFPLQLPPCKYASYPVVESAQGPPNAWGHNSRLWPIEQNRL